MLRLTAIFVMFYTAACSQEVDEHTHQHPFVNHTHEGAIVDAVIMSID